MKRFSLNKLPIHKLVLHPIAFIPLMLIGLLPAYIVGYTYLDKVSNLHTLTSRLQTLHVKSEIFSKSKNRQDKIISSMKGADAHYLDKYVESLLFLEPEIKKWEHISQGQSQNAAIDNRLSFLQSDRNKLSFTEGEITYHGPYRQVEEKQAFPVEINEDDLKKILSSIDGVKISNYTPQEKRPYFLIKEFNITKKTHPDLKEKVFVLSMHLLKREMLQE